VRTDRSPPWRRPGANGTDTRSRGKYRFKPKTLYRAVCNIFREYAAAHPDRPKTCPHALRRRAITLTVAATGSVDAAAVAIGIDPSTAKRHCPDAKKAFDGTELLRWMAEVLGPKK